MALALTIAGSDPTGAAGLQADLKTFHQLRVPGTAVVTAITYQDADGVGGWDPVPPDAVRRQLEGVLKTQQVAALKTGMLATAGIVCAVAEGLAGLTAPLVIDPVVRSTSGHMLMESDALDALRARLLPAATLVTPNVEEAAALLGRPVGDLEAMVSAARELRKGLGVRAALVTGGHVPGPDVVDVLDDGQVHYLRRVRLDARAVRGTGCTLSAAITAYLARGRSLIQAVREAGDFVHRAIAGAPRPRRGRGALDHFAEPPRE